MSDCWTEPIWSEEQRSDKTQNLSKLSTVHSRPKWKRVSAVMNMYCSDLVSESISLFYYWIWHLSFDKVLHKLIAFDPKCLKRF